ncbi:hypothetical protein POWCR01_000095800 [Plasmodium ovale]|uniref:Uncharacterized protein n=1 Tax=Plasmodium ovale TaxID=36330 RepID=A0A1C3KHL8_PLAOA|nr:hypothetical protein POWCR01_000095800 [Plasmodium ovale]
MQCHFCRKQVGRGGDSGGSGDSGDSGDSGGSGDSGDSGGSGDSGDSAGHFSRCFSSWGAEYRAEENGTTGANN